MTRSQCAGDIGAVNRALPALAVAALLVMLLEVAPGVWVLPVAVVGAGFVAWSVAGYRWALTRGRRAGVTYVSVALALGFVVFNAAGAGVGSTLLLVVVVVQAVMLLPLPWAAVVTVLVPLVHVGMPMPDAFRQVVSTGLACSFAFVLAALHLREQNARSELAEANARLRALSAQVEELATIKERARVARDIHDGLGHHLTVVGMQIQAARAVLTSDPGAADQLLSQAEEQARQALRSVRDSVVALRDARAVDEPLSEQLRTLASGSTAPALSVSVQVRGPERPLDPAVRVALYRAAQEGLTNIHKHANAHTALLRLEYLTDAVSLEVRDDGCGIRAEGGGFGLVGMGERVGRLGGSLRVESTPGAGVAVRVELPG